MINVLGVRFNDIKKEECIRLLNDALLNKKLLRIVTPNPEIVMRANKDNLISLINDFELVLKDGVGIKWAEKLSGVNGNERITGIETLYNILEICDSNNLSIYIVGSKEENLNKAISKIKERYKNLTIAGKRNGYFKENSDDEREVIDDILEKSPDCLIACMGFPKQELFISKIYKSKLNVAIGCGGAIDVISGEVKRAPLFMQKLGLEWFYRLIKEPSRFKRQLVIPKFLYKIVTKKNSCYREDN